MTSRPRGTQVGGKQGDPGDDVRPLVPTVLRVTAALGWRLLVVIAAIYVLGIVVNRLAAVVVPVAVVVLLAALLSPPCRHCTAMVSPGPPRRRWSWSAGSPRSAGC